MMSNKIGCKIRALRKMNYLTQEQMAKKLNMTRQTLSNYELGKRIPDIFELIRIADLFQISLDEIVGRNPNNLKNKDCSLRP